MDGLTGRTTTSKLTESTMMKTSVRIGAFEIDDAELHGESPGTER